MGRYIEVIYRTHLTPPLPHSPTRPHLRYIVPHITTPIYVMNSCYDAYQMGNILFTSCIPTPKKTCTSPQTASLKAYHTQFITDVSAAVLSNPKNGLFIDGCYVHEQNVNYCSSQGMPNCVGWSPLESGSEKWGYKTSVAVADGRVLTPQEAFGAYYHGDTVAAVAIDKHDFFDNPSCHYLGAPVAV